MNCEQMRDYLEAYAFDMLEPAERSAVERHLASCANCRQHLNEITETLTVLPMGLAATSPVQPPLRMKDELLRTVTATARQVGPPDHVPVEDAPGDHPIPFRTRRSSLPWRMIANVAVAALLLLSFTWGIRLAEALEEERQLRAEHAALLDRVIGEQEIVFEVIGFDDTERQFLRARQTDSTSYGKLFTRPTMPFVVVMAGRLPSPSPGETFHVWVTSEGKTTLAGQLTVDEHGFGLLVFTVDEPGPSYDGAFVTLQQAGGSEPAGQEILRS
jgi:hypothetical protein